MFLKVAWLVLRKDIAIEAKTREILYTTLFFAVACVLVFSFAFVKEGVPVEGAGVGILWIAVIFSGKSGARTDVRAGNATVETIRALLLVPAPRAAIYMGKLLGIVALMSLTELLLVPMVAFLFQAPLFSWPMHLLALLVLGTLGFCVCGARSLRRC